MKKLLFTSVNLAENPALANGSLNPFKLLRQYSELDNIEIAAALPSVAIKLHWSEVKTPAVNINLGKEILGGRLLDYKFQYVGSFSKADEPIICKDWKSPKQEAAYELFDASLGNRTVYQTKLEGNGNCNCTWLIDLLQNAPKIATDSLRSDKIHWKKTRDDFRLILTALDLDGKISEVQEFIFSPDFQYVKWEHRVAIAEPS